VVQYKYLIIVTITLIQQMRFYGHVSKNNENDWVKIHRLWCGGCKT